MLYLLTKQVYMCNVINTMFCSQYEFKFPEIRNIFSKNNFEMHESFMPSQI